MTHLITVNEPERGARNCRLGPVRRGLSVQAVNAVLLRARIAASLEKKRLRDQQRELFRKFATAAAAEELLATGFALGGKHVEATVMFSDIRSRRSLAGRS